MKTAFSIIVLSLCYKLFSKDKTMTKKTFLLTAFLILSVTVSAQDTGKGYYFDDFTPGRVILKNKQFARGKFNYDFVNHQMHFLNGTTDMIVENLEDIDTVIIDKTCFIPHEGRFLEVMKGKHAVMLLEKEVTIREHGKEGAMGLTTRGSVQAIDVNARFQRVNGENNTDLTVYKDEIKNSYLILVKKKWKSFRNQVTFLKLFSKKQQEQLKELIKAENVDFDQPEEVLKFWDKVCLELH